MQPRILLIEDDLSTASALKKVLQAEGYGVDLAERGDDGLTQATTRSFDLVLTDLRLPGLSGLELAARLHAAKPKLPIIMMTAHGTTDTAIEATKLGVYEYLVKPFEADELLDQVASAVAHSRRMSEPVAMGEAQFCALRHHWQQPRDAEHLQGGRPGRRHGHNGPDSRGNRHRQGTHRARHLPAQRPGR